MCEIVPKKSLQNSPSRREGEDSCVDTNAQRRTKVTCRIDRFGMQSKPEPDASLYESKSQLIETFTKGHDDVASALQNSDPTIFNTPTSLPRWKDVMPTVGIALGYLMPLHESIHLGQLSAWRRFQGLPSV